MSGSPPSSRPQPSSPSTSGDAPLRPPGAGTDARGTAASAASPGSSAVPGSATPIRPVVASGDWTTRRLIRWMGDRFEAAGIEPPRLVAEMLLAHVLECDRMRLYMEADRPADAAELARLRDLVRRAAAGEPVQLLVGTANFFGRDFLVDGSTLIPQPCTEELVAQAIRFLRPERASVFDRFDLQRLDRMVAELHATGEEGEEDEDADPPAADAAPVVDEGDAVAASEPDPGDAAAPADGPRVADIGTGSGCVAISIALAVPNACVLATDIADEPLALAARNAERFAVSDRVELVRGDGCAPLAERLAAEGPWDVIVSNPPYIPDAEWNGGQVEASVREHVPERALRGGEDGLSVLRPLLREAPQLLRPGGLLVLECAAVHAERLLEWAGMHPRLTDAQLIDDEDGQLRTLVARRPDA